MYCLIYLDDVIIYSADEAQHLEWLHIIFTHFHEYKLKLKPSKCNFFKSHNTYLNGSSMTGMVEDIEPLTAGQRNMIGELFDDLEVTHDNMARACSMLSSLSRSLSSTQPMLVLKASIRPMVQLNVVQSFLNCPVTSMRITELPDNRSIQVKLTMIPDPSSEHSKTEKANSVMWLLAATFAYKVLKKFMDGVTQWELQEKYLVRPKQLATYITGRRYLGGSDWKSLIKKHRASGANDRPLPKKASGQ